MSPKKRENDSQSTDQRKKKEKREEIADLSIVLEDLDVKRNLRDAWRSGTQYCHGSVELDCYPFSHGIIKNFLCCAAFTENLQKELLDLNFHEKSNDLYKYKQSDDLKKSNDPHITSLRLALFEKFRGWLSEVLELDLDPTVDLSCAKYQYTDVLLCHDDELEGRRIAFILYLVPPWLSSDGGTLDLYSTDKHCQPKVVEKSLIPSWNTLVFFEVSSISFHQVAEVLTEDKCRLSLSGWFHGPSSQRPPRHVEEPIPRHPHLPQDESLLLEWVNPLYIDIAYQCQVREEFEESSEIQLKHFLKEDKFKQVSEALQLADIKWVRRGPPNKRCYEGAMLENLPDCVAKCWELLSSEAFFLLLSNFTGLKLHYLAPEEEEGDDVEGESKATGSSGSTPSADKQHKMPGAPLYCGELRRWKHGDYTLVNDTDAAEYALDLLLQLGCQDWQPEFGGFTSYIASAEDEELLTVYPEDNSLALIYRDKETLKFVKHVNHRSSAQTDTILHTSKFYDFSFVYYE